MEWLSVLGRPAGGLSASSGMRSVILHQNFEVQTRLRRLVEEDSLLSIAAVTHSWTECEHQLQEVIPELLIANPELVPPPAISRLLHCTFPLQIWLGASTLASGALVLPDMDDVSLRTVLVNATREIVRRKACELSTLLDLYLSGMRSTSTFITILKVHDGEGIAEVPVENIALISASGNYVRVHTIERTYELRETLSNLAVKLNPTHFARVHRGHIVNLAYVRKLVRDEGEVHLILSNGIKVPIGPSYRDETTSILAENIRLIA